MARKAEIIFVGDAKSVVRAARQAEAATVGFGRSASQVHGRVSRSFGGMAASMVKVGAATAGLASVGVMFGKAARATVGFDKAMRNVNSLAQLSEGRLKTLEKRVLALAGKTAQAPQTLAEGLYDLVSSGFDANQSMRILAASAKAATAGLTTTEVSTKAVAAVLNAYHLPASKAANVSDTLFQTVNRGVVTFEELSTTIGDVLPYAAQLHVSLPQVGAAISTMTKQGLSGAEATIRLKNAMLKFIKPGEDMAAAINATGYQSGEALIKAKGFQGALEAVIKTTDGSKESTAGLFRDIRAIGGALALTGINAGSAHDDLKAFADVTGATDKALKEQSKSIAYQWQKIESTMSAVAISVGNVVVPAFATGLGQVVKSIGKVKDAFKSFFDDVSREKHGDKNNALMKRVLGPDFKPGKAKSTFGAFTTVLGRSLKDAFKSIDWQGIGRTMSSGMSKALDFTGKMPGAITAGISAALSAIDTQAVGVKFAGVLVEALGTIADPGFWVHHLGALFSVVTFVIPLGKILKVPGFPFLYRIISKPIFGAVKAVGKGLLSALGTIGAHAFTGFIAGLEKFSPRLAAAIWRPVNNGMGELRNVPAKLRTRATEMGDAFVNRLGSYAGKIGGVAGELAGRAVSRLGKMVSPFGKLAGSAASLAVKALRTWIGAHAAAGRALGGAIAKGFRALISKIVSAASSLGRAAVDVFHKLGARFFELGKNLIQGLVNGIKSKAADVANAAKGVAKSGVDAVTGFLGIRSPSRLFHKLGVFTMEGYVNGLLSKREFIKAGLTKSLLFPLDAAIAALEAKKEKLQKSWDAIDARAERSSLVAAIAKARRGDSGGGFGGGGGSRSSGASAGDVASWARSMIGHFAESTGKNMGPELDKLQATFHTKAAAWCAEFATTAAMMGGANKAVRTASVATARQWAMAGTHGFEKGLKKKPRKGDLVAFGNDHIGFVESVSRGKVHTIEGNTSAGKVARRTHAIGEGDYLRPVYGSSRARASTATADVTKTSWAKSFLSALGMKATAGRLKAVVGWESAEGGHWSNSAKFNPLNTTKRMPGSRSMNGHGVQAFKSWQQGLQATIKTIKNGKYGKILAAFRSNDPAAVAQAIGSSPWGTNAGLAMSAIKTAKVGNVGSVILASGKKLAQIQKEIDKNNDRLDHLREEKRHLGTGKKDAARRKELSDEIAHIVTRNRKLREAMRGEKAAGSKQEAVRDAIKALKDFDTQAARAKKIAKIDVQIGNLQRLKAFKDAIQGLRDQTKDLAERAADAWRTMQEKRIDAEHDAAYAALDNSAEAQELASLEQQDAEEQDRKTREGLDKDYEDAKLELAKATTEEEKADAQKKLTDAEDAIAAYKRSKREEELRNFIENEKKKADDAQTTAKDGLDKQTADYQAGLEAQLGVLTDQLEARKVAYSTWAKEVSSILSQYGLSVDTSADAEAAIGAGPGPAGGGPPRPGASYGGYGTYGWGGTKKPKKKRAVGGWTYPNTEYTVGELGPETFTPAVPGKITQASQARGGRGGGNVYIDKLQVRHSADIDRVAYQISRRLR